MPNILERIVEQKRHDIAAAKAQIPLEHLHREIDDLPPTRDFFAAINSEGSISLIAEVKKASPSQGVIREDFDPVNIAKIYAQAGAAAISVLTDQHFFQGKLEYLTKIRASVDLPLLRKDFIIDEYQVYEARVAGADAILLIAECLQQNELQRLHDLAIGLDMEVLMELYEPENLPRVLDTKCKIVGVNNRDLKTFVVDLNHTLNIADKIAGRRCLVSESGIVSHADVQFLHAHHVNSILVGESLMRQNDIGFAVRELLGRYNPRE